MQLALRITQDLVHDLHHGQRVQFTVVQQVLPAFLYFIAIELAANDLEIDGLRHRAFLYAAQIFIGQLRHEAGQDILD